MVKGLEHFLFNMVCDVTELLVELKLELIDLSSENGREHALQVMTNICPGMLTGIPFQGGDTQLREVWMGESNGVEVVCCRLGSLFCDMASPCSPVLQRSFWRVNTRIPSSLS